MNPIRLAALSLVALTACEGDGSPADTRETSADTTVAGDTSAGPSDAMTASDAPADAAPADAPTSASDAALPDTQALETSPGDTSGEDPLVACHDLAFAIACEKEEPVNGYYACSDYFGNTLGVVAQCSAGAGYDVREGGPPCEAYTHYVGSCVYFLDTPTTRDRCYVTHVGATSADKIEAGRTFWRTACAGEWREAVD